MTVIVGWEGSAQDAPHFAAIRDEVLRAVLSDERIIVHTIGYPADARDPLWRIGKRWRIDPPGTAPDFAILLAPVVRPPLDGAVLQRRVLAAMRQGIPVIATARWPLRAAIVDGVTGILIPQGKPREWNRAILRLAQDERLRTAMGAAAAHAAQLMANRRGRAGKGRG